MASVPTGNRFNRPAPPPIGTGATNAAKNWTAHTPDATVATIQPA
jgi:hypothetical protein